MKPPISQCPFPLWPKLFSCFETASAPRGPALRRSGGREAESHLTRGRGQPGPETLRSHPRGPGEGSRVPGQRPWLSTAPWALGGPVLGPAATCRLSARRATLSCSLPSRPSSVRSLLPGDSTVQLPATHTPSPPGRSPRGAAANPAHPESRQRADKSPPPGPTRTTVPARGRAGAAIPTQAAGDVPL